MIDATETNDRWRNFYKLAACAFLLIVLVFFFIAAFIPAQFNTALIISTPGGIFLMAHQTLLARRLFQLAK